MEKKQRIIIPSPNGDKNIEVELDMNDFRLNRSVYATILEKIGEEFERGDQNCNLQNCCGSAGNKKSWVGCEKEKACREKTKKEKKCLNTEAIEDEGDSPEITKSWIRPEMQKISGVKIQKEKECPSTEALEADIENPDNIVEKEISPLQKPATILNSDTKPSKVGKSPDPVIGREKVQLDPKLDKSRGFHNYFQSYLTNHTSSNLLTCLNKAGNDYNNLTESTQIKYRQMTVPVLQNLHPAEPAVKNIPMGPFRKTKNNKHGDNHAQECRSNTTKLNMSSLKVFSRSFVNFFTNVCKDNAEFAPEALLESAKIDYIDHFTTKRLKKIAEMKKAIKFWTNKAQQENEKMRCLSKYSQPKMKKERTHRKKPLPAKFINREVDHSSKKEKEKLKLNARGEPHHYVPSQSMKLQKTTAGKVDKSEKTRVEKFNLEDLVREAEVLYNVPTRRKRQRVFELEEDTNASSVGDIYIFTEPPKRARYWSRACERHHEGEHHSKCKNYTPEAGDVSKYKRYLKGRHSYGRQFH